MPPANLEFTGTDRFSLKRRLGAGGMGIVYEVHDREHDTRLALKTLRNVDPQSLYRLKQEFRALQDLQHPNLVTLGELIEDGGHWFFTMELVPGDDFLSYVCPGPARSALGSHHDADTLAVPPSDDGAPERRPVPRRAVAFDEPRLRDALGQLVRGLCVLHRAGKVHRDIKPSNILVTPEGRVVLLDFGLAIDARDHRDSTEQHVVGTAIYMAPEQAASKSVGPEADWYSVGVVLYEALTGVAPFEGSPLKVLMSKQQSVPTPPRDLVDGVPEDLDELCTELLQFDPAARPTGEQLLHRLALDDAPELVRAATGSSYTQSAPFVGRDAELAALRAAFERTCGDEPATVLVRGESGVGKTALIRHFLDGLQYGDDPVVVLNGRCYERESVPYKGFDGVVDSLSQHMRRLPRSEAAALLPRNAALLPQVFPVLGRVEAISGAPRPRQEVRDPRELRNRVFAALRELLSRLADRCSVVVVIDDLQWADADSVLLLHDLISQHDSPPLLVVASLRTGAADILDKITRDAEVIQLERLPPDQALELAAQLLRRQAGGGENAARAIAAEAAGHPMFIDELVHHVADADGEWQGRLRLEDAILDRVRRLEPDAARLLQLIALAGAPVAQSVVCQAAEMSVADATPGLSLLRVAHLVRATGVRGGDRIEPYHDRIREAVVASLTDDARRQCHARLAIALEAADQPIRHPEMLVRHLEGAGRIDEATQRAEQAARRARKGLAFDRAAQLYRTALRLGRYDDAKKRQLLIRLGEALANAGRGMQSAEAYLEATDGADPTTRLECQRQAAEQLLISGHIEHGMEALGAVLAELGEKLPATPTRALMSVLWCRTKLALRGLGFKQRHESEIAARDLTRLDVYKSVAHGLGVVDTIRGLDFQSRGLLLALKTGEPIRVARALLEGAAFLAVQGGRSIDRGRKLIERASEIAAQHDDPYLLALVHAADGFAHYFGGNLRAGIERVCEAESRFVEQTVGATWELNTTRLCRLWILRRLGVFAELGECFDYYVLDAMRRGDRHMEVSVRWACNDVWLARDRPDTAEADLDSKAWLPPEGRFHVQHFYELRARAELDLYRGDGAGALERLAPGFRALRRSLLLRIKDIHAETAYVVGRCALADGDVKRAAKIAKQLANEDVSFASVWSNLLQAAVCAADGDDSATCVQLRRAIDVADEAGMLLCAAVARRRYGQRIGGDDGRILVEDAERWMTGERIADPERMTELIAPGLSV